MENLGTLGRVPDRSCPQTITPYCPIQPLYNPYTGGICCYISPVLSQGWAPTFPAQRSAILAKKVGL